MTEQTKLPAAEFDTQAIEKALEAPLPPRPAVSIVKQAMGAVDRDQHRDQYQIEALIDQALHQRVCVVRGAYLPGPRDMHVRRMILELVASISPGNSHERY